MPKYLDSTPGLEPHAAHVFDTSSELENSSSKLVDIRNNGVPMFQVDLEGNCTSFGGLFNGVDVSNLSPVDSLADGHILVGNASNEPADVAMSGDITISNTGVTAIGSGVIVNADVNAAAAIAYSKLALSNSILNADINASAGIVYSKLSLSNSILNADVNASAAIAVSKLAALTADRVLVSDGSGVISPSAVTSTTLAFLDATSSIQTQIDSKVTSPVWSTFSPTVTLVGGAGNVTPVYTTNTGRSLVIGKIAHVEIYLNGDGGDEGAGTGQLTIALPAASGASSPPGYFPCGSGLNNATGYDLYGEIASGASVISLNKAMISPFIGDEQNNATRSIRLKFSYEIA